MKTFRELTQEWETYPYSQECFELNKACSTIELQAQFLERAWFLEHNADEYEGLIYESYFGESASPEEIEQLTEGVLQAIGGMFGKIAQGIGNIFRAIGRFLGICGKKVKNQEATCATMLTGGKAGSGGGSYTGGTLFFHWTAKREQAALRIMSTTNIKDRARYEKLSDGCLDIKWTQDTGLKLNADITKIKKVMTNALAFGGAVATIVVPKGCVSPDQLESLANDFANIELTDNASARDTTNRIRDAVSAINKELGSGSHNLTISVDGDSLIEIGKKLAKAGETFVEMQEMISQKRDEAEAREINKPNKGNQKPKNASSYGINGNSSNVTASSNALKNLNTQYARLKGMASIITNYYNDYIGVREIILKAYEKGEFGDIRTGQYDKKEKEDTGDSIYSDEIDKTDLDKAKPDTTIFNKYSQAQKDRRNKINQQRQQQQQQQKTGSGGTTP